MCSISVRVGWTRWRCPGPAPAACRRARARPPSTPLAARRRWRAHHACALSPFTQQAKQPTTQMGPAAAEPEPPSPSRRGRRRGRRRRRHRAAPPGGGGGGRAPKRRPPAGLAREDAQRLRQVTFAEARELPLALRRRGVASNNPVLLDGGRTSRLRATSPCSTTPSSTTSLAKDEPDGSSKRAYRLEGAHNSKTLLRTRGEEGGFRGAVEVIFGLGGRAQAGAARAADGRRLVARSSRSTWAERKEEREDSPAARMLNPQPVLNPAAEANGVGRQSCPRTTCSSG